MKILQDRPTLFGAVGYKRILEHKLGVYLEEPRTPIRADVEQYAVYDEDTLYVGDIQSRGAHFCGSELSEAIFALGLWETGTAEMKIEKLQKKLEIQDENCAVFVAKFQRARETVWSMRTTLDFVLPRVGWWQNDLRTWIQSAISMADKEIPRKQRSSVEVS